jgi:hypothetical protein
MLGDSKEALKYILCIDRYLGIMVTSFGEDEIHVTMNDKYPFSR